MKNPQKRSPIATVAKGVAVVAASAALTFANATPASAHNGHWIYVTGGKAIFEDIWLTVCDTALDGNQVRAQLRSSTSVVYYSAWAPSQRCGERVGYSTNIVEYRVCTENVGCSSWHSRT